MFFYLCRAAASFNMTLDGLEEVIRRAVPKTGSKVNFIRYADDSVTTANDKALLIEKVMPAIKEFLKVRGLELSEEKTKVTSIYDGFVTGCKTIFFQIMLISR